MLEQPKFCMTVVFRPPENAYSTTSRQHLVSGLVGTLLAWNGLRARVRFQNKKAINVNVDYLYDPNTAAHPPSPHTLFRDE
jgi:hypothetical protein